MPEAIRREFVGITDQALAALRQRLGQCIERPPEQAHVRDPAAQS
jgi:hypothetical protein